MFMNQVVKVAEVFPYWTLTAPKTKLWITEWMPNILLFNHHYRHQGNKPLPSPPFAHHSFQSLNVTRDGSARGFWTNMQCTSNPKLWARGSIFVQAHLPRRIPRARSFIQLSSPAKLIQKATGVNQRNSNFQ
jgi:hypothetical protein